MEATTQSIHERLGALASSDLGEFRHSFRRLRRLFPEQAAEACLLYIASHGLDPASRSMAFWLSGDHVYVSVLLDPDSLPSDMASKAVAVVKEIDQEFPLKFVRAVADLTAAPLIMRALSLVPAIGDYSILIPWLRRLSQNSDLRVRSRSSKLLCELRPNKSLIERQMHSEDARIRASAIEALWHINNEDARGLFRLALSDPHHRVVGNALVGLYLLGETDLLNQMIELCAHKDHLFRSAMAWAMGFVKDPRAIPTLQELTHDSSLVVRKRALSSLLLIESLKPVETHVAPLPNPAEPEAAHAETATEKTLDKPPTEDTSFKLFLFK